MTRISRGAAVCVACAVLLGVAVAAVPTHQQQPSEDGAGAAGGLGTVLWSVLDDCFGDGGGGDAVVCLKTRALTALDRALARPAVALTDGVSLAARDGKFVSPADPRAERAGRAALDAAEGSERKNALLDDMLADRVDRLMSTRTIVLDAGAGQEGRKKKDKQMQQALMMAGMMAAAVMGPMAIKIIALMAGKALVLSKIALVLSALIALKKLIQPQSGGHESESVSHHYGRSMQLDKAAQDLAYAAQKQQVAQ